MHCYGMPLLTQHGPLRRLTADSRNASQRTQGKMSDYWYGRGNRVVANAFFEFSEKNHVDTLPLTSRNAPSSVIVVGYKLLAVEVL